MIAKYGFYTIWVIASFASLGSLYLNEITQSPLNLIESFERICLFPLMILAGMAAWRSFLSLASYLLPQTLIGLSLSIYALTEEVQIAQMIAAGVFFIIGILLFAIMRLNQREPNKKGLL